MQTVDHPQISFDAWRALDRQRTRSARVKALTESHGWPQDIALDAMGLDQSEYMPDIEPASMNEYMPTPSEIAEVTAAIRAGTAGLSDHSVRRWAAVRDQDAYRNLDEPAKRDRFALAGRIDDDAVVMPAWFRASGER